jgi:KTSC domain
MTKDITMVPVQSSNIDAVGHCAATNTLAVRFKSGDTYHYPDCEKSVHEALVGAKSVGQHFHANIKGKPFIKQ